jgi:hypothetical protein
MTITTPRDWTAYNLSHEADVQSPDNRESPGALWLLAVRDAAVSYYDAVTTTTTHENEWTTEYGPGKYDWWHEHTHRLADDSIPLPTHERWLVFTDLCLWADEATLDIPVLTRDVSAGRGEEVDMTAQVTAVIYEVAHRLVWTVLTELGNEAEELALAELNATPGDAEAEVSA